MVEVEVNDAADTELLMQVSASFVVTALYAVLIHDLQLNHAAYQVIYNVLNFSIGLAKA